MDVKYCHFSIFYSRKFEINIHVEEHLDLIN
jgi:hypothetical protein